MARLAVASALAQPILKATSVKATFPFAFERGS